MRCNVRVSIITPVYNGAKTIRKTIESVLYQTYKNIEYIIVDGASTDGTVDIIKEYEPLFHGRLKYVSEPDKGIYNAMNKGIRMSSGQLIGIINSDDYYELNAIQNVICHMSGNGYQVIYGNLRMHDKERNAFIYSESHKELDDHMIPHPTCFVTRSAYCKYGLFLERFKIAADYELMLRFWQKGVSFTYINEVLANFSLGGASDNPDITHFEASLIKWLHGIGGIRKFLQELRMYMIARFLA